jgi:hypothetical protein
MHSKASKSLLMHVIEISKLKLVSSMDTDALTQQENLAKLRGNVE